MLADDTIQAILNDKNQSSRNKRMAEYLAKNNLKASDKIDINVAEGAVEVVLSLIGLNGVVKVVKFIFNNKETLYKVMCSVKCFFVGNSSLMIFFADGFKNICLNLNDSLASIVQKGSGTIKIITDTVFG